MKEGFTVCVGGVRVTSVLHLTTDSKKTLCGRKIDDEWLRWIHDNSIWEEQPTWRCKICEKKEKVKI